MEKERLKLSLMSTQCNIW